VRDQTGKRLGTPQIADAIIQAKRYWQEARYALAARYAPSNVSRIPTAEWITFAPSAARARS
jgi:hypothetical protein